MADGTERNPVAINRIKSRFETSSNSMAARPPVKTPVKPSYLKTSVQNGSVPVSSVKASDNSSSHVDVNSNSVPEKSANRRSQVNIPAAFLQQNTEDKMIKPKPPPPGKKPGFRENDAGGTDPPTTPVKPDKPTPPWKRQEETNKPDPPWKKPMDNGTSNASEVKSDKPIPPWKQAILDRQKEKEGENKTENEKKTEKPIPPWKMKKMESEDKPLPPWKVSRADSEEKPVPPSKPQKPETEDKPVPPWKRKDQPSEISLSPANKPTPLWKQTSEVQSTDSSSTKPTPPPATAKPKQGLPSPGSGVPGLAGSVSVKKTELENVFKNLKHHTPKPKDEPVLLRKTGSSALKRKMSRKSYTRILDDKKFVEIDIDDIENSSAPPPKPAKLVNFAELERIIADYKAQIETLGEGEEADVIEEDIYEPIPADEEEEEPVFRSNTSTKMNRQLSKVHSMIPTMDSDEEQEEEYQDTANVPPLPSLPPPIDNLAPPPIDRLPPRSPGHSPLPPRPPPKEPEPGEEEYNDCEVLEEEFDGELEQDELYEPLDEIESKVDKLAEQKKKEEEEEQKRREVERKKKEEEDKKEAAKREKQKKEEERRQKKEKEKQERELKKIMKQLKLKSIDLDKSQGEGYIKRDDNEKRGKLDLEVSKGDRVIIIKINDCPPGKWVCKMAKTGRVGYVECKNVEIDNSLLKSIMAGAPFTNPADLPPPPEELLNDQEEYDDFETGDQDQEEYDDVENIAPQQDELYEPV